MIQLQEILITEYNGPQGAVLLQTAQAAKLSPTIERRKVNTMRPGRSPIGFQSGVIDASITMTIIPELVDYEVDWLQALLNSEVFGLVFERGEGGLRVHAPECMVSDAEHGADAEGNATVELTIAVLDIVAEPS